MKKIILMTIVLLFSFSHLAHSEQDIKKKLEEVVNMAKEAAGYLAREGEKGLPEFNKKDGRWVKGELYVFVYGLDGNNRGVIIAHPRKGLVGKNFLKVKDKRGKIFAADFLKIAESKKGEGWSEYWWPKLSKGVPEPKISYIVKVPGQPMLVGVGAYYGLTRDKAVEILGK